MKLTIPQVMMLNHAAYIEHENGDLRYAHKKAVEEWHEEHDAPDPVIEGFGKPLSELSDAQMNHYLADWGGFG
jgi:hypothetical protein